MRRLLACSGLVTVIAAGGWFGSNLAAARTPATMLEARVGDSIRVVGAPIGCQVVRVRDLGGRITLDCRRAGALAGTYGTLMTADEAAVMRFESSRRAKLVLVAPHKGGIRQCR